MNDAGIDDAGIDDLKYGPVCIETADSSGETFALSRILMRLRGYPGASTLLCPPELYCTLKNVPELQSLSIKSEAALRGVACLY